MVQYVDTVLKQFPFSLVPEHEEDVHLKKFHKFDFDYIETDEEFPWEDPKKINEMLSQELARAKKQAQSSTRNNSFVEIGTLTNVS